MSEVFIRYECENCGEVLEFTKKEYNEFKKMLGIINKVFDNYTCGNFDSIYIINGLSECCKNRDFHIKFEKKGD